MTSPRQAKATPGGRMYVNPLNGEHYRSVTNCLSIIDKPALKNWAAKQTAEFAWDHRDTWIDLPKRAAVDLMKREALRYTGAAAEVGTAVHELVEKYVTGERVELDIPADGLDGYVDQFCLWLEEFAPEFLMTEATAYHEDPKYAGSFDALVVVAGRTLMVDYKTGGVWPEAALQLAAYSHADYVVAGPPYRRVELPPVDGAAVLQIKSDHYEFIELDAGDATFRAFRAAAFLAQFKADRFDFLVGDPLRPLAAV